MTTEEVLREITHDYNAVMSKARSLDKIIHQEMRRSGLKHQTRLVKYKSNRNNVWSIVSHFNESQNVKHIFFTETHDKRGKVAYQYVHNRFTNTVSGVLKFNSHFFQRYRERQQPKLSNETEVIRHFFRHNMDCRLASQEVLENGTVLVSYVLNEGVGMGWLSPEKHIGHVRTFIPHHMLSEKQESIADRIKDTEDFKEFRIKLEPPAGKT